MCALKTVKGGVFSMACFCLAGAVGVSAQVTMSTNSVADAFVRSADPTHNYGGAGALSVSGTIATNANGVQEGSLDSFMRFDVSSSVAQFNATYGVGDWHQNLPAPSCCLPRPPRPPRPSLIVASANSRFRWISNNSWGRGYRKSKFAEYQRHRIQ